MIKSIHQSFTSVTSNYDNPFFIKKKLCSNQIAVAKNLFVSGVTFPDHDLQGGGGRGELISHRAFTCNFTVLPLNNVQNLHFYFKLHAVYQHYSTQKDICFRIEIIDSIL